MKSPLITTILKIDGNGFRRSHSMDKSCEENVRRRAVDHGGPQRST